MIAFEWCGIEISAFVTGAIDRTELGINSIVTTLLNVLYMVSAVGLWGVSLIDLGGEPDLPWGRA